MGFRDWPGWVRSAVIITIVILLLRPLFIIGLIGSINFETVNIDGTSVSEYLYKLLIRYLLSSVVAIIATWASLVTFSIISKRSSSRIWKLLGAIIVFFIFFMILPYPIIDGDKPFYIESITHMIWGIFLLILIIIASLKTARNSSIDSNKLNKKVKKK
tara:strand:+ start:233 stop:709 length:477 start_codon:yes stop_codon:yes gene_type:complete